MSLIENKAEALIYMTAPNIETVHAFTTRYGGVSGGAYSSLNLGRYLGDDPVHVRENYKLVRTALGIPAGSFASTDQVHGSCIVSARRADCGEPPPLPPYKADGLVTRETGVALIIFTADCVPVLLHDPVRGVIAAVHAGWRGTAAGITGKTVLKMVNDFGCAPSDIRAAIGPCISKCCYETGADVADALRATLGDAAESCVSPAGGKYMTDLKEANRLLLTRAGLTDIIVSDECTSCMCDKYWSYRRVSGKRGSQAAIILLR